MLKYRIHDQRITIWLNGNEICRDQAFEEGTHSIYCRLGREGQGIKIVLSGDARDPVFLERAARHEFEGVIPHIYQWVCCDVEDTNGQYHSDCDVFIVEHVEYRTDRWAMTRTRSRVAVDFVQRISEIPVLLTGDWFKPTNSTFRKRGIRGILGNILGSKTSDMILIDFQDEIYYPRMSSFGRLAKDQVIAIKEIVDEHKVTRPELDFYQGFVFDNLEIRGFRSPKHRTYDSYVKLRFAELFYIRRTQASVLDLGCAEGFFGFQASLVGASRVVAIEHTPRSFQAAMKLNQHIFHRPNIEFKFMELEDYLSECEEVFDLVYALSVFHQGYSDFKKMAPYLEWLAEHAKMIIFETPLDHHQMRLSERRVTRVLKQYFRNVYPLYRYPSYVAGSDRIIYRLKTERFFE
jgi:SAM-dependent methyltransferase